MRYFVTLDGQSFSFAFTTGPAGAVSIQGSGPQPMQAELLRPHEPGRPALVRIDGRVFRAMGITSARRSGAGAPAAAADTARLNGWPVALQIESELQRRARPVRAQSASRGARVVAPMPGRIVKLDVRLGQIVQAGAPLLGIEAMKMENELRAPSAGRIAKVSVEVGSTVEAEQELVVIEPAAAEARGSD